MQKVVTLVSRFPSKTELTTDLIIKNPKIDQELSNGGTIVNMSTCIGPHDSIVTVFVIDFKTEERVAYDQR